MKKSWPLKSAFINKYDLKKMSEYNGFSIWCWTAGSNQGLIHMNQHNYSSSHSTNNFPHQQKLWEFLLMWLKTNLSSIQDYIYGYLSIYTHKHTHTSLRRSTINSSKLVNNYKCHENVIKTFKKNSDH